MLADSRGFLSSLMPLQLAHVAKCGVGYACQFNADRFSVAQANNLEIDLPTSVANSVSKRQAEFVAGRYLAQKCIQTLGLPACSVAIGANRAPVWPAGVIGSISHSQDRAICYVFHSPSASSTDVFGLDLEHYLGSSMADQIHVSLINSRERAIIDAYIDTADRLNHAVAAKPKLDFAVALTMVFSAKESLFKALYPQVARYFDFLDVEVTYFSHDSLELTLCQTLTTSLVQGTRFTVHVLHFSDYLITYTSN